ncbi:hypothetical protein MTP09_04095 [Chryseobacterium suipulveris]|uniref:General stress protein 17M-like domain-containing protein n=1 Tax=Chryseobacterium suipulveris TaxID=2929800 RepID=A0ABY4BRJ8_9FLAO|nr:hypothetical protein [Chryseobacterium suipulveris]UOE41823.1 hypothetical protein MTP09_04095 [Chryseobacterium suipulveris]
MNYTVVGLFPSQDQAKDVSASLEEFGFEDQDYIIYRTDRENAPEVKRNFWKRLFGQETLYTEKIEQDKLITSVVVQNEEELDQVKKSFERNDVVKIYEFQDMTLEEAKDLNYIKKIVELRAKSHIYAMPEIAVSSGAISEGINAEVKA